jgi:hypothetical protein
MLASALITDPISVLVVLLATLAGLFTLQHTRFGAAVYKVVPLLVFCYFVPTLLSNVGLIPTDPKNAIYLFTKDWLLPASLFLLVLAVDIKAFAGLGRNVVILFFVSVLSIMLAGPLAYLLLGGLFDAEHGEQIWRGLAALSGSWIGGGANMTAVKESVEASDSILAAIVVVDVFIAELWTATSSSSRRAKSAWTPRSAPTAARWIRCVARSRTTRSRFAGRPIPRACCRCSRWPSVPHSSPSSAATGSPQRCPKTTSWAPSPGRSCSSRCSDSRSRLRASDASKGRAQARWAPSCSISWSPRLVPRPSSLKLPLHRTFPSSRSGALWMDPPHRRSAHRKEDAQSADFLRRRGLQILHRRRSVRPDRRRSLPPRPRPRRRPPRHLRLHGRHLAGLGCAALLRLVYLGFYA